MIWNIKILDLLGWLKHIPKKDTDGQTDERTDGRTDGRADGRTDGRTDKRTDGRTDERTDVAAAAKDMTTYEYDYLDAPFRNTYSFFVLKSGISHGIVKKSS